MNVIYSILVYSLTNLWITSRLPRTICFGRGSTKAFQRNVPKKSKRKAKSSHQENGAKSNSAEVCFNSNAKRLSNWEWLLWDAEDSTQLQLEVLISKIQWNWPIFSKSWRKFLPVWVWYITEFPFNLYWKVNQDEVTRSLIYNILFWELVAAGFAFFWALRISWPNSMTFSRFLWPS